MKVFSVYYFAIIVLTSVVVVAAAFAGSWSSEESIELPKRRAAKMKNVETNYRQQNRPIVELFLGVLDTLHAGTKAELKRAKQRSMSSGTVESGTSRK